MTKKYAQFISEQQKKLSIAGLTEAKGEGTTLAQSSKHVEDMGSMKSHGTNIAKSESSSFTHGDYHYHPAESHDNHAHFITQHKTTGKVSSIKVPLKDEHHDEASVPSSHVSGSLSDEHKSAAKKLTKSINSSHFG